MNFIQLKQSLGDRFLKVIEWVLKQVYKIRQFTIEKIIQEKEHKFLDLTPEDNGKDFDSYFHAINWALKNEKVTNLALTGPYGSGKSSILKSFEKLHPNYKYLWISLASFNEKKVRVSIEKPKIVNDKDCGEQQAAGEPRPESTATTDENSIEKEMLEQKIELSIFQQLFYQERSTKLPLSRFKRIDNSNKWISLLKAITPLFFLLSIVDLFEISFVKQMNLWQYLYDIILWPINFFTPFAIYHKSIFNTVSFIVFFSSIIWLIYTLNRLRKNSTINKFKIQNAEIEISPKVSVSILNKYLDEILYYFEVSKKNVVILEDLDRFGNKDIFVKLREINFLINKSRSKRKRVVFLYAIKDDMFKNNEDRTKFFDYMIPVIPVISSANSKEWLFEYLDGDLKTDDNPNGLSMNFIKDVSKFIDDMRLLKSICNEYFIYKERLSDKENKLNKDNLFSMILYKNMFPDCFVELQLNKGEIYNTFKSKSKIIESHIDNYNKEIEKFKDKISLIESHRITDIRELRSLYINELRNHITNLHSITINKEKITIERFNEILVDDLFYQFQKSTMAEYIRLYMHSNQGSNLYYYRHLTENDFSFKDIENKVSNFSYTEREMFITSKTDNITNELKIKIDRNRNEIDKLQRKALANLKNDFEIDSFLPNNKLIKYLIRNGYIDENYHNYISYFYEGSLTLSDNDFLLNVISNTKTPFDYELFKIGSLINEIDIRYFSSYPILNYNLMDYLLLNSKTDYLHPIFNYLLKSESKHATDFIDGFLDNGLNKGDFIKELVIYWNKFWFYIENVSNYTDDKIDICIKLIIDNVTIHIINTLGMDIYLKQKNDFLSLFNDVECEAAKSVILALNIKFLNLEFCDNRDELLNYIYENNLYEVNINNVLLFAQHVEGADLNDLKTANYTTLLATEGNLLKQRIKNEIDNYISFVFLKLEENKHETEYSIKELLNNENVSINNKKEIVKKEEFTLIDLSEIHDFIIQEHLLQNNKVFPKWKNIIDYFDSLNAEAEIKKLDETLVNFINNKNTYDYLSVDNSVEIKNIEEFLNCFITEQKISDDCFVSILNSTDINWAVFAAKGLSDYKINFLISNKIILFNSVNYDFISAVYSNRLLDFIEINNSEFESNYKELILNTDIFIRIVKSGKFSPSLKLDLYKHIIDNELFEVDFIKESNFWNEIGLCVYIENTQLDFALLKPVFRYSNHDFVKVKVLNTCFDHLNEQEIVDSLTLIGGVYKEIAAGTGQQKLDIEDYNKELIENLKTTSLVSPGSGKELKGKLRIYHYQVQ